MNDSQPTQNLTVDVEELLQQCFDAAAAGDKVKLGASAEALDKLGVEIGNERAHTLAEFYSALTWVITGDLEVAKSKLEAVLPKLEALGETTFISRAYANLGRISLHNLEWESGMSMLQQAMDLSIADKDIKGIQRAISLMMQHNGGDPDSTLQVIESAIGVLGELGEVAAQVEALTMVTLSASNVLSKHEAALRMGNKALELSREIKDPNYEALSLDALGGAYWTLGDAGRAAEHHLEAIRVAEQSGNRSSYAQTIMNAGYAFIQLEDFEKVAELNRRGLAVYGDTELVGVDLNLKGWLELGLAHALLHLGDHSEAMTRATRAIDVLSDTWDTHGLGYAYYRRGEIHSAAGELNSALTDFQKSLDLRIKNNTSLEIAESECEIGKILVKRGEYEEALGMLKQALSRAEESSNSGVVSSTHLALSDAFAAMEDHAKAHEHLRKHLDTRAKLINQEASRRASGAEIRHQQELHQQKMQVTESILNNVLPPAISERLKTGERQIAETIPAVSVLFADIVGFTPLVAKVDADDLVNILAQVFGHFDEICAKHGLEKIKTIGDAYMAVAGAPEPVEDHALRCAAAALEMLNDFTMDATKFSDAVKGIELDFRIGIHSGSAVAGVIGEQRIAYDLWGDAVNVAARMESHGVAGKVHVSHDFREQLKADLARDVKSNISIVDRGEMDIKGRGTMRTYFLE